MLTSKQRAYLRGLANKLDTILIVGKGEITDNIIMQADTALTAREIIKGRVLENSSYSSRECADCLAEKCNADVVQVIGSKFVLYRPNPDEPVIVLPKAKNPIHNGHIQLARYCQNKLGLDKVIFIPTYTPPHKASVNLADSSHRISMCKTAVLPDNNFEVSDIEIRRKGKSYTFETLNSLKELFPEDTLYLIMGADMFLTLADWKNPKVIFKNAVIAAIPRNDSDKSDMTDYYNRVLKPLGANAVILDNPVEQVSSTYIRDNIDKPELVSNLLDKNVYEYIAKNNIYRK